MTCPVCERAAFRPVVRIPNTTVSIGDVYADAETARRVPRGDIDLAVCTTCGLVRNTAFDESLLVYDAQYDNSQMFSPTFRRFAKQLAEDLVSRYRLTGRRVVEIGCGKGEFLELLVEAGIAEGVGFDPTYTGEVDRCPGIRILRQNYDTEHDPDSALLLSRHVVEHLLDPLTLFRGVRRSLEGTSTPLYIEVPDAGFVLTGEGLWDVIYPHVSYFSSLSLRTLLARTGFVPHAIETVFADQFLAAHASPGPTGEGASDEAAWAPEPTELTAWLEAVDAFGERFRELVAHWTREIASRAERGPVVLWGAGAKGVAFLNLMGTAEQVRVAVDMNPRKHGKYLPGTAHEIVAPEALCELRPTTVLVMNALYANEIQASLKDLGLDPDVVCV